jgi:TPP-dependent indolepyruvate ferredoxin oxidoreductase alpha subunit
MAVAKLKGQKEDRLEELAERFANDINERAAKMTPEKRQKANSETKKIADRVQRRTPSQCQPGCPVLATFTIAPSFS